MRLNGLDLMRSIIWIKPWLSAGQMPLFILGCLLWWCNDIDIFIRFVKITKRLITHYEMDVSIINQCQFVTPWVSYPRCFKSLCKYIGSLGNSSSLAMHGWVFGLWKSLFHYLSLLLFFCSIRVFNSYEVLLNPISLHKLHICTSDFLLKVKVGKS